MEDRSHIKDLEELGRRLLAQGGVECCNGEKLEAFPIDSHQYDKKYKKNVRRHHVFFTNKTLLEKLGSVTTGRIDGTFKTSPSMNGVYQLVTIMTTVGTEVRIYQFSNKTTIDDVSKLSTISL